MREIVTLGIGGYGVTITDSMMKAVAKEMKIDQIKDKAEDDNQLKTEYPEVFFEETKSGAWKSRSILVDSDSCAIDNARSGSERGKIYGVDNFCHRNYSLGSIFAKGMYGEG